MGLNEYEERILRAHEVDLASAYRDDVALAAQDFRLVESAKFLILGETMADDHYDHQTVCEQIGGEYMLTPDEIVTAMELAEERIELG